MEQIKTVIFEENARLNPPTFSSSASKIGYFSVGAIIASIISVFALMCAIMDMIFR